MGPCLHAVGEEAVQLTPDSGEEETSRTESSLTTGEKDFYYVFWGCIWEVKLLKKCG